MSEQKHESWEIEADEDGDFFHIGPVNEYGALVLSIARTSDERAAQLIAAAPDLLEALKGLRACISETRGEPAREAVEAADKAIAKAQEKPQ